MKVLLSLVVSAVLMAGFAKEPADGAARVSSAATPQGALLNVVDAAAAAAAFADYTNNVLRIEMAAHADWNEDDPRRRVDRFPANMPFQLAVGSDSLDGFVAQMALTTVETSMPRHVRDYFVRHRLLAQVQQWIIRRAHPSVVDEDTYLSAAAHPVVWTAKDFDLRRIGQLAAGLASNTVPVLAVLQPVYEEYKTWPIRRALPLVDYPDPRPEETYVTPFGVSIVLRAMENRRKFRFSASGYPFRDANVNFKWVPMPKGGVWIGNFPSDDPDVRKRLVQERGCGEVTLSWWGARRRDVLVFARYGKGPYGPPSVISFYTVPNERRKYEDNKIESVEYVKQMDVIPQLYQNKPWKDAYVLDTLGNLVGFRRTRTGRFGDERFTLTGELVTETFAGDTPKESRKVRYFTSPDDPGTLDFAPAQETTSYRLETVPSRDRGEFPAKSKRR